MKDRAKLDLAEACGATLTGAPDGTVPVTVVFTPAAWREFSSKVEIAIREECAELCEAEGAYSDAQDMALRCASRIRTELNG